MISNAKLLDHCTTVYRALEKRAERDGTDKLVFEGSKVDAFREAKISQGYYSLIFDVMTEAGWIEQTRRGGGRNPSLIVLHRAPVAEELEQVYLSPLTKSTPLDTIRQQMEVLARRLPSVDVDSFIVSLDHRLTAIEARLDKIERRRGR